MVDRVHAWQPGLPLLREAYHARFDHAYPMHAHADWTVLLVDDGAVEYDLDGSTHLAAPGALTLLPPGIPHDGHAAVPGREYRKRVLYLEAGWLPAEAPAAAARRPTVPGPEAVAAARRVHAALASPGDQMAAEHGLLELRGSLLGHLPGGAPSRRAAPDRPLARRVRDALDAASTEPVTISALAARFGAHPSHLVRAFTREYGIPPHRYLVSRRVDRARGLLVRGHSPAEAAVLAGFHDQSHLTRHFRRILGTTPAAFAGRSRSSSVRSGVAS